MARTFEERDGKPNVVDHGVVNLGIAVDVEKKDGSRSLMVPCIRAADQADFKAFHANYEELIRKTRENSLTADDFQGTNITLTNPGGLGTVASVPRLMSGQGTIVATGSIAYPAEWAQATPDRLKALGVSKVMTMTSTYDHRIIQGAESGSFLRRIDQLLSGEDDFYEGVAAALGIDSERRLEGPCRLRLGPAARRRVDHDPADAVGRRAARRGAAAGGPGGDLAAEGLPDPRPPLGERSTRSAATARAIPRCEPENLNLTPELMGKIPASILRIGVPGETLLDALPRMRDAYCGTIAYQVEHLSSHQQRVWLREMIETGTHRKPLENEEKRNLLIRLIEVYQFERFLQKAYLGQKMFSIEGARLDRPDDRRDRDARPQGGRRAGRDRHGPPRPPRPSSPTTSAARSSRSWPSSRAPRRSTPSSGPTRSATAAPATSSTTTAPRACSSRRRATCGCASTRTPRTSSSSIRSSPAAPAPPRPSIPARRCTTTPRSRVPLLLHGDAAFPGQGVVAETLNLQSLEGYKTGGTIHIIQDNQVGFTTDPQEGRSTPYAADMAKGFNVPIIHVNADDPESCIAAIRLAMAYRAKFARDVVIDLIGYRRYGHNETDEPAYTQPEQAAQIKKHPPISEIYAQAARRGGRRHDRRGRGGRQRAARRARAGSSSPCGRRSRRASSRIRRSPAAPGELDRSKSPAVETKVSEKRIRTLNEELISFPDSFTVHRKLRKPLERRVEILDDGPIEYGHAEALAYASLLTEGTHIRLTGQDTERGTFSNRHLVLHDEKTGPQVRADPEPLGSAGAVRDPQQPAVGERDASASSTATRPPRRRA